MGVLAVNQGQATGAESAGVIRRRIRVAHRLPANLRRSFRLLLETTARLGPQRLERVHTVAEVKRQGPTKGTTTTAVHSGSPKSPRPLRNLHRSPPATASSPFLLGTLMQLLMTRPVLPFSARARNPSRFRMLRDCRQQLYSRALLVPQQRHPLLLWGVQPCSSRHRVPLAPADPTPPPQSLGCRNPPR